ncbi:MAG: tol-pal system-associated acyl-CoA thioesterase [Gallionellales bacterium GWA2_59_43]|nr:MAG: tol-pal system-associated acyl-CoA thioesterase [Gallionellales bacterium GWA2_59_43]
MSKHKIFAWPTRVYYQDTDAGGVVYHANYVNFMERARTEWLRTFGYSNAGLMTELGVMFVVRKLELNYLRPALLDDMLSVTAQLKDVGRSRITLVQTVMRGDELLTEGEVHLVCVGAASFKPVSVPVVLSKHWKI